MWKALQRYAAALVPQEDDGILPLTNQQAHQLETQQSRNTMYRQAVLNDLGEFMGFCLDRPWQGSLSCYWQRRGLDIVKPWWWCFSRNVLVTHQCYCQWTTG